MAMAQFRQGTDDGEKTENRPQLCAEGGLFDWRHRQTSIRRRRQGWLAVVDLDQGHVDEATGVAVRNST